MAPRSLIKRDQKIIWVDKLWMVSKMLLNVENVPHAVKMTSVTINTRE